MKKITKCSAVLMTSLVAMTSFGSVLANATDVGTMTTNGTVEFSANAQPQKPGDPDGDKETPVTPGPETPPTPTTGPLSIVFASNMNFGKHAVGAKGPYYARPQKITQADNKTINYRPLYVQVSDLRGTFAGWTLKLKQNAQFLRDGAKADSTAVGDLLKGAQINFTAAPKVVQQVGTGAVDSTIAPAGPKVASLTPGVEVDLMSAASGKGMGTWYYTFGQTGDYDTAVDDSSNLTNDPSTKSPVQLALPDASKVKASAYNATLTWTLSDTPPAA